MRPTLLLSLALAAASAGSAVASPPFPIATGGACYDSAYYTTVAYVRGVIEVCMHNPPIN